MLTDFIRAVIQPACLSVCLDKPCRTTQKPRHHDAAGWKQRDKAKRERQEGGGDGGEVEGGTRA